MLMAAATLAGCGPVTFVVGVDPGDQKLKKTVIDKAEGTRDQVAIVDVSGMLLNGRRPGLIREGDHPVSDFQETLVAVRDDRRVKAVILRINSPGGTVTASDVMYREVLRFRQESGKPVVALLMDVAASGGYYVACGADRIVAYPTSITGSIGVIVQTISVKPALSRIGVQTDAIVSGPNKDAGSPLSVMTPDQRQTLEALVVEFYDQFKTVVHAARPQIAESDWSAVTDGRVLSGADAAKLGLVDAAGDLYDALDAANELAGIEAASLVIYHRPLRYVGSAYAASPSPGGPTTQVNLAQINMDGGLPGFDTPVGVYYLWAPQAD